MRFFLLNILVEFIIFFVSQNVHMVLITSLGTIKRIKTTSLHWNFLHVPYLKLSFPTLTSLYNETYSSPNFSLKICKKEVRASEKFNYHLYHLWAEFYSKDWFKVLEQSTNPLLVIINYKQISFFVKMSLPNCFYFMA